MKTELLSLLPISGVAAAAAPQPAPPPPKAVQEQLIQPIPSLPLTMDSAGLLAVLSILVPIVIGWLRRRFARDANQITQDKAEGVTVKTLLAVNAALIEERDKALNEARDAWSTRTLDAAKIAMLEERNANQGRELDRLRPAVATATQALQELSDSGITPLSDSTTLPKPSKRK